MYFLADLYFQNFKKKLALNLYLFYLQIEPYCKFATNTGWETLVKTIVLMLWLFFFKFECGKRMTTKAWLLSFITKKSSLEDSFRKTVATFPSFYILSEFVFFISKNCHFLPFFSFTFQCPNFRLLFPFFAQEVQEKWRFFVSEAKNSSNIQSKAKKKKKWSIREINRKENIDRESKTRWSKHKKLQIRERW